MKKQSRNTLLTIGLISLLLYLTSRKSLKNGPVESPSSKESDTVIYQTIVYLIASQGYSERMGYYWYLVAKMETDGFTSSLFRTFNNLFGMRCVEERQTTQTGCTTSNFGIYKNQQSSVDDLVLYLKARKYPSGFVSLYEMIQFMKSKNYFGNESIDSYYAKVKAWENRSVA